MLCSTVHYAAQLLAADAVTRMDRRRGFPVAVSRTGVAMQAGPAARAAARVHWTPK